MSTKKYEIGQVVFVVLNKKGQVVPVRVVEEQTKRSLNGIQTKFMVQASTAPDSELISLDDLDAEVFDTAEDVKSHLVTRASMHINKIVNGAVEKAKDVFGVPGELASIPSAITSQVDLKSLPDKTQVVLEDGTVAKIKLPDFMNSSTGT